MNGNDSLTYVFKSPEEKLAVEITFHIGHLIMSWAICESLFFGMFICLVGGKDSQSAELIWLSNNSTRARIDQLTGLCVTRKLPQLLSDEIHDHVKTFKAITSVRNRYCHAYYAVDPITYTLTHVEFAKVSHKSERLSFQTKSADKALLNELENTIAIANKLNETLWPTLIKLKNELGAQNIILPEPFPEHLMPK